MLAQVLGERHPTRLALVGGGGSGKSTLAAALGYRVAGRFPGGVHWFRVGAWDVRTLGEILALRFGVARAHPWKGLRATLSSRGPMLIVLDNHEDDRAIAALFERLGEIDASVLITARRCLLAGVSIFPVVPPLITSGRAAFPSAAGLTRLLRFNPLALDVASALIESGETTARALGEHLSARGVGRVRVIEHEDDLPEVKSLVEFAWRRLDGAAKRLLAVLAHTDGDHMDRASLLRLARGGARGEAGLERLRRWHVVEEPVADRFSLHATVRYAVLRKTRFDLGRYFEHYLTLLEAHPERLALEQSHLFASMELAHGRGRLEDALRLNALLARLEA